MTIATRSQLRHVTPKHPCPVCEKPDWCSVSENGEVVICMRVSEGAHSPSRNGGWTHLKVDPTRPREPYTPPRRIVAVARRRHAVYSALLDRLPLSNRHWDHLQDVRMLSADTITRCQFATVPSWNDGERIAADLDREIGIVNVPGFYWDKGKPRLRFAGLPGFFIPLRDHEGQISALQIRRDSSDPDRRYLLVSSNEMTGGASSGAPPHFARPSLVRDEIYITEGGLKAEVCAELLNRAICGLVAVGTFDDGFGWKLRTWFPRLRRVYVAYDQETKPSAIEPTKRQKERLIAALEEADLRVTVLEWPAAEGKGLDDYWINKRRRE